MGRTVSSLVLKIVAIKSMSKPSSACPTLSTVFRRSGSKRRDRRWLVWMATAMVGVVTLTGHSVKAQGAAPEQLRSLMTGLDNAANSQNARSVVEFFSPNFTHSDGLNKQTLQDSLTTLWKQYPNLKYRTELKAWKRDGNTIVADTITYITGTKKEGDREFKLNAQLEARQRIENQKIISQEILNERSQLTSGANPPTLKVNLPAEVQSGQEFAFDAVVQEPLGDDLLMGAALEEAIKPEGFLNTTTANLEPLNSGGIFKVGKAPNNSEQHWLSAIVVRHDGMTLVTQRLRIKAGR